MKKLLVLLFILLLLTFTVGCSTQSQPLDQTQVINTESSTISETAAQAQTQPKQPISTTAQEEIGEAKAKSIALEHAKLSESSVSGLFVELDYDDGILRYEVDFRVDNVEYDYDIDAYTGNILSYDKDIDD